MFVNIQFSRVKRSKILFWNDVKTSDHKIFSLFISVNNKSTIVLYEKAYEIVNKWRDLLSSRKNLCWNCHYKSIFNNIFFSKINYYQ